MEKRFQSFFAEYWAETVHHGEQDTDGAGSFHGFTRYLDVEFDFELESASEEGMTPDRTRVLELAAAILDLEEEGQAKFNAWKSEFLARASA